MSVLLSAILVRCLHSNEAIWLDRVGVNLLDVASSVGRMIQIYVTFFALWVLKFVRRHGNQDIIVVCLPWKKKKGLQCSTNASV